jgi:hypothetical protein
MKIISPIGLVLGLAFFVFASGALVHGLASQQVIQFEGPQETELLNAREDILSTARINKQIKSKLSIEKRTFGTISHVLHKKDLLPIFRAKIAIFIRHCSLLI